MPENPPRSEVEEQVLEDQKLVNERKDHIGKPVRQHAEAEEDEDRTTGGAPEGESPSRTPSAGGDGTP